jgi:ABC-type transport system involved in multi-copper enzyme maturation permease subunit
MSWLLWRQHRRQGGFTLGALGVFGVLLWITGVSMAHTYHVALSNCAVTDTCNDLQLFQGWGALFNLVNFTVVAPVLIGVFWGATAVGRELDTGTNRLVWTQSVTRRQWLRSKIVLLLISSAAVGAALAGLVTWWSGTNNSLHQNRFDGLPFDIQGVSPIGYTLFAATLGLACGVLWRRTLPAIATTLGVFFVVRLVVESYVRPHYMTPVTTTVPLGANRGGPAGAWIMSNVIQLHGQSIGGGRIQLPQGCAALQTRADSAACLAKAGYLQVTKYQPAGRYWNFQLIELAIFLVLAAVLTVVAVVALKRQDA